MIDNRFLVNKEIQVDNLTGDIFVVRRLTFDHHAAAGGILKVDIGLITTTKQLNTSATGSRHRHCTFLREKQKLAAQSVTK